MKKEGNKEKKVGDWLDSKPWSQSCHQTPTHFRSYRRHWHELVTHFLKGLKPLSSPTQLWSVFQSLSTLKVETSKFTQDIKKLNTFKNIIHIKTDIVVNAYNPSTHEAQVGGSYIQVQRRPHSGTMSQKHKTRKKKIKKFITETSGREHAFFMKWF